MPPQLRAVPGVACAGAGANSTSSGRPQTEGNNTAPIEIRQGTGARHDWRAGVACGAAALRVSRDKCTPAEVRAGAGTYHHAAEEGGLNFGESASAIRFTTVTRQLCHDNEPAPAQRTPHISAVAVPAVSGPAADCASGTDTAPPTPALIVGASARHTLEVRQQPLPHSDTHMLCCGTTASPPPSPLSAPHLLQPTAQNIATPPWATTTTTRRCVAAVRRRSAPPPPQTHRAAAECGGEPSLSLNQ